MDINITKNHFKINHKQFAQYLTLSNWLLEYSAIQNSIWERYKYVHLRPLRNIGSVKKLKDGRKLRETVRDWWQYAIKATLYFNKDKKGIWHTNTLDRPAFNQYCG
jgi:hypothetical protein